MSLNSMDDSESATTSAALERRILSHIDQLPRDLQKRWIQEYEAAEDDALAGIESRLKKFLQDREKTLYHTAPGTMGDLRHSEHDSEKIRTIRERIDAAHDRPDLYVGEGKTAHVYQDAQEPKICYKTVTNFSEYEAWNSVAKEARFLEDLEDLEVGGVRTPRVSSIIDLPDIKAIAMEYFEGENVRITIEKRKPLPENFDVDTFFKKVRAYISEMHKRNIYHRDLQGGNILISPDGSPRIIDFGRSTMSVSPEHAYEAYDRLQQNRIVLPSDEEQLAATESLLRRYIAERQMQ